MCLKSEHTSECGGTFQIPKIKNQFILLQYSETRKLDFQRVVLSCAKLAATIQGCQAFLWLLRCSAACCYAVAKVLVAGC